ncbi:uncharacterized protein N0V89_012317 [Didymosphaeria variabile]|uniref:Uncharacterized protein n=1 Tax=Didymosphaeria variabile TaxID=1932322 RepID=A0A9W8X906_9PLEO|nr:uncharacterized protein N0V89_012317 [Didymosphaeria variabile]KAJ4344573.1 hypothetical protein N0V89_012317 [Didymosphaeria variabile]
MPETMYNPSEQALPRDGNGNIDVNTWARDNLDQDMITENVRDLEAQKERLHKDFVQYATQWPEDTLVILCAEGYEFHLLAPCLYFTAKRYKQHAACHTVPNSPTLIIDLPFHDWMVNAAVTFWKTHSLAVPSHDSVNSLGEGAGHPQRTQRSSLLRLVRMVNVAIYTQDPTLLSTIYATIRSRLVNGEYDDEEFLDAVKFVWCKRPVSWERYEAVRKILLTELLRVRGKVCERLEKYFQHVVEESGGEEGAFMMAFNLGQIWWEENEHDTAL